MALESFPALIRQYTLFLDRGSKWGSLNSYYGAFSLARAFGDEPRGREVVERLVGYHAQRHNYGLAGRLTSIATHTEVNGIFRVVDSHRDFMWFAEHGELPTQSAKSEPAARPSRKWHYLSRSGEAAAILIMALGLWSLFGAINSNSAKLSYGPSTHIAAVYSSVMSPDRLKALQKAGWLYDGNGFEHTVESGGISQIVVNSYKKLGGKGRMSARLAGLLADEIIHTEGSQVENPGEKGNWGDLSNPKKNVVKPGYRLRAHPDVIEELALLTEKF